jgi:serine/threonine protein kinase
LGVLVFELLTGKTPFRADDSEGIYTNIQHGNIQYLPTISGVIKDLVSGLLTTDPKKRLGARGAAEIKEAAWFQGVEWEKIGHLGITPPIVPAYVSPESLEQEKVSKGIVSDYSDILGDRKADESLNDPYNGVFKGF